MASQKEDTALNGARAVGILAGGKVYVALPTDPREANGLRSNLNAQLGAVVALDRVHAMAAALDARRHVLHDPLAEQEAREEEREQIRNEREIARELREAALYEARFKKLCAQHRLEVEIEFKGIRMGLGKARMAQREAEAAVGEAVAREGLKGDVLPPESAAKPSGPSLAAEFARRVDDLEEQIVKAEAAGQSTEALRSEQDLLNKMLRRELLKGET